jgi:hypothetical protein
MIDLTKIKTPFGLLEPETQEALRAHGGPYELYDGPGWSEWHPMWINAATYRVKPQPLTKPSIDWSHVAPEYKWLARDENGDVFVYAGQPSAYDGIWKCVGGHRMTDVFASCTPGTCDWRDSLVERPE